jgi:hypothetical protein
VAEVAAARAPVRTLLLREQRGAATRPCSSSRAAVLRREQAGAYRFPQGAEHHTWVISARRETTVGKSRMSLSESSATSLAGAPEPTV